MKKLHSFSLINLIFSLVVFIIGIVLITNTSFILNILSWIIGGVLGVIGIIKIISYLRNKKYNGDATPLLIGIFSILIGIAIVVFPNIIDITFRLLFGGWILFSGINRLIFAFALYSIDRTGFKTFLTTSIIMFISGILILISFYELVGILLIIYSISEIVNYIYYHTKKKNYNNMFNFEEEPKVKKKQIKKEFKEKEAIDAVIDQ